MSSEDKSFEPSIVPTERPGKEGGVRARNRRQRTADLCQAGLRLFRDRGLEATTVDEITREAGVSKGTFYRYFNDKAELVAAIFAPLECAVDAAMDRCREALEEASDAELEAAYARLAVELGAVLLGSPETVDLYLTESRGADGLERAAIHRLRDKITDGAIDLTRVAQRRGLLRELPVDVTAVAVVGAIEALLTRFFAGRVDGAPDEVAEALISMVLDGSRRR